VGPSFGPDASEEKNLALPGIEPGPLSLQRVATPTEPFLLVRINRMYF
jgi:hypothetical protein